MNKSPQTHTSKRPLHFNLKILNDQLSKLVFLYQKLWAFLDNPQKLQEFNSIEELKDKIVEHTEKACKAAERISNLNWKKPNYTETEIEEANQFLDDIIPDWKQVNSEYHDLKKVGETTEKLDKVHERFIFNVTKMFNKIETFNKTENNKLRTLEEGLRAFEKKIQKIDEELKWPNT